MDKLRKALSGDDNEREEEEENGFASQFRDATTMGWSTRIKGFAICFVVGFILSILGVFFLVLIPVKGLKLFALFYTFGNIASLSSTCFLMGPVKQLKRMFNSTRVLATFTAISFLILTLVAAFKAKPSLLLVLLCCIIQFLAMTWYSISYIPYAREAILKVINI